MWRGILDYLRSDNGTLPDELLNLDVFDALREANVLTERWRREYNISSSDCGWACAQWPARGLGGFHGNTLRDTC